MVGFIKRKRQDKDFRIFCFTVFNAAIAYASTELTWITWEAQAIIVWLATPILNAFSKYVNIKYFGDIGVHSETNN